MSKDKQKKEKVEIAVARPSLEKGLTSEEAELRRKAGLGNDTGRDASKGFLGILFSNVFNFFNTILFSIALIYFITSAILTHYGFNDTVDEYFGFSKYLFLIVLVFNTVIATVQEYRSKRTISKLKLVSESGVEVVRDGQVINIKSGLIVRDDVCILKAGNQCPADIILADGTLEVDESMLTGESELIRKRKGDTILAGSSIVVGAGKGYAEKVGRATYSSQLSEKVRALANHKSRLMIDINAILKINSIGLVITVGIVIVTMIIKLSIHGNDAAYWGAENMGLDHPEAWARIIVTSGSFAVGVIPSGLVLLTSITLAISIIKLGKKQTLVQSLYSLENLSRVDIICLDKTGTLTDGTMEVDDIFGFADLELAISSIKDLLGSMASYNQTAEALYRKYGRNEKVSFAKAIPFSSATKCSGLIYKDKRKLLLGAPEYVLEKDDIPQEVEERQMLGQRVIALTLEGKPLAFFALRDNLRKSCNEILPFFYENGVDVKIISGDNVLTVAKIAADAGVKNAEKAISLEGKSVEEVKALAKDYVVFARVSPEQKQALVEALQTEGHKVAMTGDGVNDILALRKSDASITFATATDAAKSCADVVLLDNDFAHLKDVVSEGRRVIHNVERSASMFLMKSIFIFLLSIILIFMPKGHFWYNSESLYGLELAVLGLGCLVLSFENNNSVILPYFRTRVYQKAAVSAILIIFAVLVPLFLGQFLPERLITEPVAKSLITVMITLTGLIIYIWGCVPFNRFRVIACLITLGGVALYALMLPSLAIGGEPLAAGTFFTNSRFLNEFFQPWNSPIVRALFDNYICWIVIIVFVFGAAPLYVAASYFLDKHFSKKLNSQLSALYKRIENMK